MTQTLRRTSFLLALLVVAVSASLLLAARGREPSRPEAAAAAVGAVAPTEEDVEAADRRAVPPPKPLSDSTLRGVEYLVTQQLPSGGWGQGGGWRQSANGGRVQAGDVAVEHADVGNTAMATLALVRAGSTPSGGEHAAAVRRGVDFICRSVEQADPGGPWITDVRDTQIQLKIGRYVDTFLSSLLLTEVKGTMPDEESAAALDACLEKVVGKIEANQLEDGTFEGNRGWASVLSQGLSVRALNKAKQKRVAVSELALERAQKQAEASYDQAEGRFRAAGSESASDAGVGLYSASSGLVGITDSVVTGELEEKDARAVLASEETSASEKQAAQSKLARLETARAMKLGAKRVIEEQLNDPRFVAGFGSNGGEEFLSYMNISESLLADGGEEWLAWDRKMAENLERVQNTDGSWSGHHCITGRTFITSAALLVLLADRAPLPDAVAAGGGAFSPRGEEGGGAAEG